MSLLMGLGAGVGTGNLIKPEGSNRRVIEVMHGKSNLRQPPWTQEGIAYRPRILQWMQIRMLPGKKDMSNHAQTVMTKSTTSQVMECNEELGSIDHRLFSNRTQDLQEHNQKEVVSLREGASPTGLPLASNKNEVECKKRKQEKPFLGAGRASEKTTKRRSL